MTIEALLPLIARLHEEPCSDNRLRTLAQRVGLSPTHLQRVFSRMIGESPKRIARRIALERAAAVLVTSDAPILEIALASGFESHEGFTRAFRAQFERSPSHYRACGLAGSNSMLPEVSATHRDVVENVGPCICLFGTRVAKAPMRRATMSSTVVKKHLEQTPILFMRRRVEHDQIAQALGELLPAVYGHAMKHGIPMAGPPFCRYENWTQGGVTLEAGLPIAAAAEGEGDIVAGTLAGGPVATTIHIGPYDGLPKAHAALERWFADNGLEPAGAPWESYLTDPGEVPDPAQWQTAIIRPIRS